ncbi:MAG: UDP-N-acetylmuramate--L-alanine ligase [Flavobacteriaceae bacterium]|nr:UDP-N-acetylmuramate--L-alanine ligase [Flavobacteriaceae bacterium]
MTLKDIHNVYFIGIGGIGMSALARYFEFIGKQVAGYDRARTPLIEELMACGIDVHFEDDLKAIAPQYLEPAHTLVVYTPAVPKAHSELDYFSKSGHRVMKRAEVLGLITKDIFCLAVAGTHGKTTTSSILAHLLYEAGNPIIAFLGGISEDFNSNFVLNGNEYAVVEADEYDRSFLHLHPNVACITSMDADHLDIYGSGEKLEESFRAFASQIKPGGTLIVKSGLPINGLTYGIEDGSDYEIKNIRIEQGTYVFDIQTPNETVRDIRFNKPGQHNLLNGLAAFAMAVQTGSPTHRLAEAMASFKGVERRFSYRLKNEHIVFIDDYAHHPTEIDAVYQAVVEMHPDARVLVVFQPHLFSRTQDFADAFAASLSRFDSVLLLEIYPARELPIAGVDSAWLLEKIKNPNKKLIEKENILHEVRSQSPDILITMGAGDIGLEVERIKSGLAYAS